MISEYLRDHKREFKLETILKISKFSNWNLDLTWAIELKVNNSDSTMSG